MADERDLAPSRIHRAAAALIEVGWLGTVVLVPLVLNPWGLNYELTKVALFRALTLLMLAAHVVAIAWGSHPPNPRRWLSRPLVAPILLVASATLLSLLTSISPLVSLWGSYHRQQGAYLLACAILWALLVAHHLQTPAQRSRLAVTIAATGTLVALTPFLEALYWSENVFKWRPGGSLGNPIFLGATLILTLPFTLALVVQAGKRRVRLALGTGGAILQAFALLITQSRGPWVGALVGLVVLAGLMLWHTQRRLVMAGGVLGILLAGSLLVGLNLDLVSSPSLSELPYVERVIDAATLQGRTVRVRVVLWEAAAGVVTTWPEVGLAADPLNVLRPFLGYGPDTASIVYTAVYPPELAHIEDPSAIWDRAHNETLDLLVMQGWVGLAAWIILGAACVRRGVQLWQAASNPVERVWAAAPLAALAAHLVEIQFAFSITTTILMGWLCVAWLAAPSSRPPQEMASLPSSVAVRRWRLYASVGAALLVLLAVRLEGGATWANVLIARARSLDRAGEWKESVALYDRALALVPWQATAHQFRAEAFYDLARALPKDQPDLRGDLLAAADRSLANARRLEPLELELYSNGGILHAYWSETVDPAHLGTAIALYQQAFSLAPTRVSLRVDLGHVFHNHGLYPEALVQYDTALEIDPHAADAYYGAGLAWLALDQPDRARQALESALALSPRCGPCQEMLDGLDE